MEATKTKTKEKKEKVEEMFRPLCFLQTHMAIKPEQIPIPLKKSITPPRPRPTNDFGF